MGNEFTCGQLGSIEIATGEARTADMEFTRKASRHRITVRIQEMHRKVINRFSDGGNRRPCCRVFRHGKTGDILTFRRAVMVIETTTGQLEEAGERRRDQQTLAGGHDFAQAVGDVVEINGVGEALQDDEGQIEFFNALGDDEVEQRVGVLADFVAHQNQRATGA